METAAAAAAGSAAGAFGAGGVCCLTGEGGFAGTGLMVGAAGAGALPGGFPANADCGAGLTILALALAASPFISTGSLKDDFGSFWLTVGGFASKLILLRVGCLTIFFASTAGFFEPSNQPKVLNLNVVEFHS